MLNPIERLAEMKQFVRGAHYEPWNEQPVSGELSRQGVAGVNSKTMAFCNRFVAACADDFICHDVKLNIITDKEVIEQIQKEHADEK